MTSRRKGLIVLAVQLAVVLSVAVKYAWERHACPQVWTRAGQWDPEQPLRGRYLALQLRADGCGLPRDEKHTNHYGVNDQMLANYSWQATTAARDGKLVLVPWDERTAVPTEWVRTEEGVPCERMTLGDSTEFFVSEKATLPVLKKGQELWALVTVPPQGPPRPVELAVAEGKEFRVLQLR
ncbi:MAG: hypothetical protein V4555_06925 [Acidobacteriota bacterium]